MDAIGLCNQDNEGDCIFHSEHTFEGGVIECGMTLSGAPAQSRRCNRPGRCNKNYLTTRIIGAMITLAMNQMPDNLRTLRRFRRPGCTGLEG